MGIFSISIETVHKWALFAGFTGAVLTALGAGIAFWTGSVLSDQSNEKIENARSSADIARRDTEILRKENLGLQREVEDLRTKRLEMERQFGPRRLAPHQIEAFNTAIPVPLQGTLVAIQVHSSPESLNYARQLAALLSQRGVAVQQVNSGFAEITFHSGKKEDVEIKIAAGPGANVVAQAFKAAGFKSVFPLPPGYNVLPDGRLLFDHRKCAAFIDVHEKAPVILGQ